jgi:apolipoprotein N-acyltransferase
MRTQRFKSTRWAYLWLALTGVLNLFASGRWTFAPAAWLAPVFALLFLHSHPRRIRFLYFYGVYWITLSIAWYGATPIWGIAHFLFMAVNALIGALPFLADRWLAPKLRQADAAGESRLGFAATLIYPTAGTALEYLTSRFNPIGNFGALGYSQYAFPVLTQVTAITGLLGLTFLLSWFASVVVWVWDNGFAWKRVRVGVLAYATVLAVVVGYGAVRLGTAPEPGSQETVTVISFTLTETQMGELNDLLAEDREAYRREAQDVHAQYLAMTESAIAEGAEIVLWPELAVTGLEQDVQAAVEQGRALARQAGIYLAMPTFTLYPESDQTADGNRPAENVLVVADPEGEIALEHVKYGGNLIEGTLKGSGEIQAIDTPYGTLSGIICWDTNYPGTVRQVGEQDVDILMSPAKDWPGINPLHAEMAVFRAIENGTAVVRQADEGLSIVVDAYGRTLATGEGLAATGNYVRAEVPTRGTRTLYPVIGDLVGLFSLIGFVIAAVYALFVGRRTRKQESDSTPVPTP